MAEFHYAGCGGTQLLPLVKDSSFLFGTGTLLHTCSLPQTLLTCCICQHFVSCLVLQQTTTLVVVVGLPSLALVSFHGEGKKHKTSAEATKASGQSSSVKAPTAAQPTAAPAFPSFTANPGHVPNTSGPQSTVVLSGKEAITEAVGMKKTSFAGLFSNNCKLTDDNKLMKFAIDDGALKLESNDLIDVATKLGYCLVSYIAEKFLGLKAIRALA
ncbi:hypothetical protein Salat_2778000 [Sesamum alatum]|uniref:Uncharacterized protein n=1 Tax=Sesamum alatum TaxID=300844 RepID=A0AAE1XLL6_9LAMI|nr:hypothetical protein Salat_2778000 [Sesamum alatum]